MGVLDTPQESYEKYIDLKMLECYVRSPRRIFYDQSAIPAHQDTVCPKPVFVNDPFLQSWLFPSLAGQPFFFEALFLMLERGTFKGLADPSSKVALEICM